jgi:hypothetical protein
MLVEDPMGTRAVTTGGSRASRTYPPDGLGQSDEAPREVRKQPLAESPAAARTQGHPQEKIPAEGKEV